ncbi:SDR family NAD(P)-dependent oxidoreductase [Kibdelosporangium phytohabitans]|uniref:SDR family NAD(P)-dependent oxidoreductase n=1 Tax=Kibdelosporangium phytohabitans TaxID=860235 RepID=UPI000A82687B|nr:NAD(P)-dependent dehydrogenase (short-subunit alcohol dehydrogenase family) [Kibdelosporangium phytohabitans]
MTVLVLGGRSEIGLAVAKRLASEKIVLAARRGASLDAEVELLLAAGAPSVERVEFDADVLDTHGPFLDDVVTRFGPISVVVVAFGILGSQERAAEDAEHAVSIVHTDYVAHVSVLTHLTRLLRQQGGGTVVVFSSIAGGRVRKANYVYGSAKAGLDGFASGLADSLHGTGVRVLTVRPGFVIGRMAAGMSPAPFASTPDQVAEATVKALRGNRYDIWVPGILRWVNAVFRVLPRAVWRRMPR